MRERVRLLEVKSGRLEGQNRQWAWVRLTADGCRLPAARSFRRRGQSRGKGNRVR